MKNYLSLIQSGNFKPVIGLKDLSRLAATEGIVLLKNEYHVLPLIDQTVSVFGRIQLNYYKSGTGSGGLVNVDHVTSIMDACLESPYIKVNDDLLDIYRSWELEHPFNAGSGFWASEPWSQEEMPLTKEIVLDAKKVSDVALIVIGRTAGEDRDNSETEGSYRLSKSEEDMIGSVTSVFDKVVVLLNTGNVMDMSFMDQYPIQSVLYLWHGGQEGGRAAVDVLTGLVSPSGKLPDTIPYHINDFPSTNTFGGKEVVQVYVSQPQGKLGKPNKVLIAFQKTGVLKPGEAEVLSIHFDAYDFASYDEVGLTGFKSSYVLEEGDYVISFSTDVNHAFHEIKHQEPKTRLIQKLEEVLRPVKAFKRIKPELKNGVYTVGYEDVPLRSVDLNEKIKQNQPIELKPKHRNITLEDVYQGKASLDELIAEMSLENLSEIVRGEGMSSPKVTPGTASAFGGTTNELKALGLPVLCCSDGPSGIRMDSGLQATSMPNGTLLASTMNTELVEALYYGVGLEMVGYNIDILLGPGMNIHRHPLCGRNFEYFSEDPLLTGYMGAAVVNGLQRAGVTGTIKHMALNNQEYRRFDSDSIASERAIREIYLKGFEIAVKKAHARAIMTSYNPINGIWAAGNYDLIARVIRHEWDFKGIVMTDWWAKMNDDQEPGERTNIKSMIKAQGDLYMVVVDAKSNSLNDNFMASIENGSLTKAEAQVADKNIISFILNSSMYQKLQGNPLIPEPKMFPLPVLKKVFVNGIELESFDERVTHYHLDTYDHFNLTFELEPQASYHVKRNAHQTIVSLLYHQAENHYVFTNRKRFVNRETFDLNEISLDHPLSLLDTAWGRTPLDLKKPTWKSEKVLIKDDHVSMVKDGILSYTVEIKTFGKYIVELSIASDALELSQLPFSILCEDVVLSTLTTRGTGGKWFDIASQFILEPGIKRLSFKAHASGLNIKRIDLIKHQ